VFYNQLHLINLLFHGISWIYSRQDITGLKNTVKGVLYATPP